MSLSSSETRKSVLWDVGEEAVAKTKKRERKKPEGDPIGQLFNFKGNESFENEELASCKQLGGWGTSKLKG